MNSFSSLLSNFFYRPAPSSPAPQKVYIVPGGDTFHLPKGEALIATAHLAEQGNVLSLIHMADFFSSGIYTKEPGYSHIQSPENLLKAYSYLLTAQAKTEDQDGKKYLSNKMDQIQKVLAKGADEGFTDFITALKIIEQ